MTATLPVQAPLTDEERRRLGELYEANHAAVLRLCARMLRDPEDAADACHEVFITASREFTDGSLPASPRAWLLTVARNHCLDLLRRRKRFGKILTTMGNSLEDAVNPEATVIRRHSIDAVLRGLSPRERQALWQSAVESRPLTDIATGLRLNYMAAAQVLSRARRHAALAMSRVAAILMGLRLLRRDGRAGTMSRSTLVQHSMSLVAAVAVPIVIAATQASSNPMRNGGADHALPAIRVATSPLTVARTDHRGVVSAGTVGQSRITGLLSTPLGGQANLTAVGGSTLNQITNVLSSIVRGLPPTPIPVPTPTLPPIPQVH